MDVGGANNRALLALRLFLMRLLVIEQLEIMMEYLLFLFFFGLDSSARLSSTPFASVKDKWAGLFILLSEHFQNLFPFLLGWISKNCPHVDKSNQEYNECNKLIEK